MADFFFFVAVTLLGSFLSFLAGIVVGENGVMKRCAVKRAQEIEQAGEYVAQGLRVLRGHRS